MSSSMGMVYMDWSWCTRFSRASLQTTHLSLPQNVLIFLATEDNVLRMAAHPGPAPFRIIQGKDHPLPRRSSTSKLDCIDVGAIVDRSKGHLR